MTVGEVEAHTGHAQSIAIPTLDTEQFVIVRVPGVAWQSGAPDQQSVAQLNGDGRSDQGGLEQDPRVVPQSVELGGIHTKLESV